MDKHLRELERQAAASGDYTEFDVTLERAGKKRLVWCTLICQSHFTNQVLEAKFCLQNRGELLFVEQGINNISYHVHLEPISDFESHGPMSLISAFSVGQTLTAFMFHGNNLETGALMEDILKILHIKTESLVVDGFQRKA